MDLDQADRLEIERLGGLGGFGLPGSRIRSLARIGIGELSAPEREALAPLFAAGGAPTASGGGTAADAFRYRLTLEDAAGRKLVLEVPEHLVPVSLQEKVRDELT